MPATGGLLGWGETRGRSALPSHPVSRRRRRGLCRRHRRQRGERAYSSSTLSRWVWVIGHYDADRVPAESCSGSLVPSNLSGDPTALNRRGRSRTPRAALRVEDIVALVSTLPGRLLLAGRWGPRMDLTANDDTVDDYGSKLPLRILPLSLYGGEWGLRQGP